MYSANRDGDVIAFDVKTGKSLWKADLSDINNERSFWDNRIPPYFRVGLL
ncbi:hypothetical protein L3081_05295 [Colwellia sp. MSW7]|uniref:Uncharacterized protein n=1 Tax=Colwellia maritima TaxID=2912588 RepID=A0ABS9X0B1_9GAMM|nr:hypothetical protein [Colwellia maritima]